MSYDDTGILHILVIDDDPSMCEILSALFLSEGYLVITADSAEKGLEQLPFYTFDVAFIDQYLPGMEGLVFGEYLGKNNPEMEIVLITGSPATLSMPLLRFPRRSRWWNGTSPRPMINTRPHNNSRRRTMHRRSRITSQTSPPITACPAFPSASKSSCTTGCEMRSPI